MMINSKSKKIILFVLSLSAFIFFFPWKFENGESCLADHYFGIKKLPDPVELCYEVRVNRYLVPYGILWWISISGIMFLIFIWQKRR